MSDLDEKLQEALKTVIKDGRYVSHKEFLIPIAEYFDPEHAQSPMQARLDNAVAQIKQSFIDAGWLDTTQLGGIKSTTICRPEGNIEFMTGQEWYDRFRSEVSKQPQFQNVVDNSDTQFGGVHPILAAAKKAAGINE